MHRCEHRPTMGQRRMRRFAGARLHRRLFWWMGLAIFVTFLSAGLVMHWVNDGPEFDQRHTAIQAFAERRFAEVWDNPQRRSALAEEVTHAFSVALSLKDPEGRELTSTAGGCTRPWATLVIAPRMQGEQARGTIDLCGRPFSSGSPPRALWGLFIAAMVLWLTSGMIARRLVRPLEKLVQVTTQIGQGDLSARVRLGRHLGGEVGRLSYSINHMAERIDRQMSEQRQLLAGVSHEVRTPLARLRIITELLRDKRTEPRLIDDAEREIAEIDDLVGQLLASSRLEFVALSLRELNSQELCLEALRREGLGADLLQVDANHLTLLADPTLLGRALSNLLRNAKDHGGQVTAIKLREKGERLYFEIIDDGPGFNEGQQAHVFEPFVQGHSNASDNSGATLGLGLALVKRIALAHDGDTLLESLPAGGACVGFWLPHQRTKP